MQKARLARIRIAKASSGAAFLNKKRAAEARLAAQESGIDMDDSYNDEDIFELQHHHLLQCLEKTTVRMRNFHLKALTLTKYFYNFRIASSSTWTSTTVRIKQNAPAHRHQWPALRTPQTPAPGCCSRAVDDAARNDIRYLESFSKSHHKLHHI